MPKVGKQYMTISTGYSHTKYVMEMIKIWKKIHRRLVCIFIPGLNPTNIKTRDFFAIGTQKFHLGVW